MTFGLPVLAGVVLVIIALKKGLGVFWPVLFNIAISIFLAVMFSPSILRTMENHGISCYWLGGITFMVAAVIFGVLEGIAYRFFSKGLEDAFPRFFNVIGAVLCAFWSGYVICHFVYFVICLTPVLECPFIKDFVSRKDLLAASSKPIIKTCGWVSGFSLQFRDGIAEGAINNVSAKIQEQIDAGLGENGT